MKVILEKTTLSASNIWSSKVEPNHLLNLTKKPIHQKGSLSILMVDSPAFDKSNETLQFNIESVVLLNLGNSSETIIIDSRNSESDTKVINSSPESASLGDQSFFDELDKLPPLQKEMGKQILDEVRSEFAGELKYYSKSGKFVESPDNFWVVKIQPRVKNFRIIIYGEINEHKNYKTIELKPDMNSYSSFIIGSKDQTNDAISAIKDAKKLKNTKR